MQPLIAPLSMRCRRTKHLMNRTGVVGRFEGDDTPEALNFET